MHACLSAILTRGVDIVDGPEAAATNYTLQRMSVDLCNST